MESTNNFNELPKTRELWVKIDEFKLKVLFKDDKWLECLQYEDNPEIFLECGEENMEAIYTSHALMALKVYARISKDERIDFAGREIGFFRERGFGESANELNDGFCIQTGKEEDIGGEPSYPCEIIRVERKKWLEIMAFFEKASALFLNFDDFSSKIIKRS